MSPKRTVNGFGARSLTYCDGCGSHVRCVFDTEREQWLGAECCYMSEDDRAALRLFASVARRVRPSIDVKGTVVIQDGAFEFRSSSA